METTTQPQGWLKLFYQFRDWEWYGDPNMVALFIHLLLRANYKPVRRRGEVYGRGVVLTSREELSRETGISERTIRTCLTRLKSTNEITIKATKQGSVITLTNYDKYQNLNSESDQPSDQRPTNDRPTTDQRPTNDRPTTDQRPTNDRPTTDQRPTNDRPTTDQRPTSSIEIKKEINKEYLVVDELTREEFFNDFFSETRKSTIDALCMNNHTDESTLRRVAKEVLDDWQGTSEPKHRDLHEAQKHLLNQIRVKLGIERREQKPQPSRPATANRAADKAPRNVNDSWADFTMPTE